MKKSMRGFIDPYSLGFVVVLLGAFFLDIHKSGTPPEDKVAGQNISQASSQ